MHPCGFARLRLGPTRPELASWLLSWERGHLARMNNRGPSARCGQDARAPRKGVAGTWLGCNDDGASGSSATHALDRLPGQAPERRCAG